MLPSMSAKTLAEKVGVSQSYVSHILAGRRRPGLRIAMELASRMGIGLEELANDPVGCLKDFLQKSEKNRK